MPIALVPISRRAKSVCACESCVRARERVMCDAMPSRSLSNCIVCCVRTPLEHECDCSYAAASALHSLAVCLCRGSYMVTVPQAVTHRQCDTVRARSSASHTFAAEPLCSRFALMVARVSNVLYCIVVMRCYRACPTIMPASCSLSNCIVCVCICPHRMCAALERTFIARYYSLTRMRARA